MGGITGSESSEGGSSRDVNNNEQPGEKCGKCREIVGDEHMGIQCSCCEVWMHCECVGLDERDHEYHVRREMQNGSVRGV